MNKGIGWILVAIGVVCFGLAGFAVDVKVNQRSLNFEAFGFGFVSAGALLAGV